ncbi:hypothetical protein FB192DRAFT_1277695 [Mucor lusitanicus]|uniref:BHLH domain-containing protein n=1 Tax=Mucor circinelloides f. lusitanicus TaxID=29924 RepID=A0A8H4BJ96_MUCCL|nr:hypothetical protein FB192DRAFT_1277695 [Mucor lusitanicus]
MEEDEDSEEDFSQDDGETSTPSSIASSSNAGSTNSNNKRPATQALFLNFTSDLSPQKMSKKKSKPKKQTAYRVNGVNILNRNNLDSKTAIERIQRRRENHNHVERRRRDNINNTIFELSSVVPNAIQPGQKPNKGNILKLSLDYIRELQSENAALKERLSHFSSSRTSSISPPLAAATLTTAPMSASVPSSPHQQLKEEGVMRTSVPNNLPPPLSLPPPQQHQPPPPHQQQLQSQNLRPLLPATKSPHPPAIQNHQTAFLPALRMSGYEKIYGNVCRY